MKKIVQARLAAIAAGTMVFVANAQAALPTEATAAFTEVLSDGKEMVGLAWPVAVAITGGFILIKIFKKGISKAT